MITQSAGKASSMVGAIWAWSMRPYVVLPQLPQNRLVDRLFQTPMVRVFWSLRELILAIAAYMLYLFARKVILSDVGPIATDNAHKVVALEQKLLFFWEPSWQGWAIENARWLVVSMNWAYIMTFFPIIVVTSIIFYLRDRPRYIFYRNIILISYIAALLVFVFFPLTPPRMLGAEFGIIDSIAEYGPAIYGGQDMASFYNAYAAMPSVHFSWTILFGILFWNTRGPRWLTTWLKLWAVSSLILAFFAITITGNHYILDAMAGALLALLSLAVYKAILFWLGGNRRGSQTLGRCRPSVDQPLPRAKAPV